MLPRRSTEPLVQRLIPLNLDVGLADLLEDDVEGLLGAGEGRGEGNVKVVVAIRLERLGPRQSLVLALVWAFVSIVGIYARSDRSASGLSS
jgi:hypothetical protein